MRSRLVGSHAPRSTDLAGRESLKCGVMRIGWPRAAFVPRPHQPHRPHGALVGLVGLAAVATLGLTAAMAAMAAARTGCWG